MNHYVYRAVELSSGRQRRGTITAVTQAEAAAELKTRGMAPVSVLPKATQARLLPRSKGWVARLASLRSRRTTCGTGSVSRRTVMLFTRQLATLVNAGMPLARCLEVLKRQERSRGFCAVITRLEGVICAGGNFSDGLGQHPKIFEPLYVNMVKAGEAGGVLGPVLERLAQFMEKSSRLKARVKSAMIYPIVIMAVAGVILSILMIFVVPKFEQIFSGLLKGQPLPALTRALLGVSTLLRGQAWIIVGCAVLAGLALQFLGGTPRGQATIDWLRLRVPVFGELTLKASIARFTRTLGSLLASGVSILEALAITRNTSGNVHVSRALDHVHDRIKQGGTVARSLEETAVFPGMVTGMIQVGEETGSLPEMLGRIASTYDEEVDVAVAGLTSILEPIMIVVMAAVVGMIVIALFLPIVSVIEHLQ
ncbi:MAG: pilus assembly protein PilC [Verrucomicrobia bacterium]|nr:pilus assembly protein PilC [Verrucomicrobiota bacterium]